jgi:hypothetical protein
MSRPGPPSTSARAAARSATRSPARAACQGQTARRIAPGYQRATLHLKSGKTLNGVLRDYTTYDYTLQDAKGDLHFIKAADVSDSRLLPGSPMPSNYKDSLTATERRDLIKFLSRQSARGAN